MSKDYYGTYAEGIKNLDKEVADNGSVRSARYLLADTKAVFPRRGTLAVIMVQSDYSANCRRQGHVVYAYNSGSIWVKKGGKWLETFHTEAKAQ